MSTQQPAHSSQRKHAPVGNQHQNVLQPYYQGYHCRENSCVITETHLQPYCMSHTQFGLVNSKSVASQLDLPWNLPAAALRVIGSYFICKPFASRVNTNTTLVGKENTKPSWNWVVLTTTITTHCRNTITIVYHHLKLITFCFWLGL